MPKTGTPLQRGIVPDHNTNLNEKLTQVQKWFEITAGIAVVTRKGRHERSTMRLMKRQSEMIEGPEAWKRFEGAMRGILAVPHSEIQKRIEEHRNRVPVIRESAARSRSTNAFAYRVLPA